MSKQTYCRPSVRIVPLRTKPLLTVSERVPVRPEEEGNQEEAEAREWSGPLWEE